MSRQWKTISDLSDFTPGSAPRLQTLRQQCRWAAPSRRRGRACFRPAAAANSCRPPCRRRSWRFLRRTISRWRSTGHNVSQLRNIAKPCETLCNLRHRGGETLRNLAKLFAKRAKPLRNAFPVVRNRCETFAKPCEIVVNPLRKCETSPLHLGIRHSARSPPTPRRLAL